MGPSTVTRPHGPQSPAHVIAVNPHTKRWFRPLPMPQRDPLGALTCQQGKDWRGGAATDNAAQYVALIKKALSCGLFQADEQGSNGTGVVRLVATERLLHQIYGKAGTGHRVTLWVSAKTYLPVRLVLGPGLSLASITNFAWLAPRRQPGRTNGQSPIRAARSTVASRCLAPLVGREQPLRRSPRGPRPSGLGPRPPTAGSTHSPPCPLSVTAVVRYRRPADTLLTTRACGRLRPRREARDWPRWLGATA